MGRAQYVHLGLKVFPAHSTEVLSGISRIQTSQHLNVGTPLFSALCPARLSASLSTAPRAGKYSTTQAVRARTLQMAAPGIVIKRSEGRKRKPDASTRDLPHAVMCVWLTLRPRGLFLMDYKGTFPQLTLL